MTHDWAFQALAEYRRNGGTPAARGWRDQVRGRQPQPGPDAFWDNAEVGLLRAEVAAAFGDPE